MCTLTYLPLNKGFIFTHNRDERKDRPSSDTFRKKEINNQTVYYPEDLEAHGTWFAFSNKGMAACILNGGSKPHKRKEKYRKSRGLVVLESFEYSDSKAFFDQYDFDDIEPFTLLIFSNDNLSQIIHNEENNNFNKLNTLSEHIWSSTTLYTKEVRDKRKQWFVNWLSQKPQIDPKNTRKFHTRTGDGDSENDLIMSRWGILKTVSLTQVAVTENKADLYYEDFVNNNLDRESLLLTK